MSNYKINIDATLEEIEIDKQEIKHLANTLLSEEQVSQAEVNIILVNEADIVKLNQEFLNKNTTTDVLSFNLEDDPDNQFVEGEVYVNVDQINRQANDYQVSWKEELYRVLVHGLLHLVGYNDQTTREKRIMTEKEDHYLALLSKL